MAGARNGVFARLEQELRDKHFQLSQKVVQLESLYQAGLALAQNLQVESISEEFLLLAVSMVDARGGVLFLADERARGLVLVQQTGLSPSAGDLLRRWASRRLGRLRRSRQALRLQPDTMPAGLEAHYGLIVAVGRLGLIGVLDKESRKGVQAFTEEDAHLLELMGQQAGAALANARLYRAMLEEKTLTQNILASVGNGVISTDLQGRIVRVNPAVNRILRHRGNLSGRSCVGFLRQQGCDEVAEAVAASLADGQDRQVANQAAAASNVVVNARITPLREEQAEIQGLVVALEDLTQERRLHTMFRQYASDQVVDLLVAADAQPALGGEQRDVTILFVDIRGSTALLGAIGAEEMVALLNECFSHLVDVIFQYNGTLDKFTGDGFMVVYGAPLALPDDSRRAAQTALAIRQEMTRFNRRRRQSLGLGMGLSRGTVVAGNIGSLRRMEYTVIGPKVNLASRLCDRARSGQIWADRQVRDELAGQFDFAELGWQSFKGSAEPVEAYELVGPKGRKGRRAAAGTGRSTQPQQQQVDLSIPMLPEMELAAGKTAAAVGEFMRLDQEKIEELRLALGEACINAFEHSQSKDRRLDLHFELDHDELRIRIVDRGQGFDVAKVRRDLRGRRERGERRRGWGLTLMEELMDQVEIQADENGTTITLVKRR